MSESIDVGASHGGRAAIAVVAAALIGGAALLMSAPSPANAAKPATAAQKNAMAKAVPAAASFDSWRRPLRRCYALDRASAKRSTVNRRYRFALVRYRERATGPCSTPDDSSSFYAYWRVTSSGLRPRGTTNQFGCFRGMKVPMAVQREMFPGCPVG